MRSRDAGSAHARGVRYHGIDIAIQEPAPNLIETDIIEAPIAFGGKTFDVIVAQGMFEYVGRFQSQKFAEIASLLNDGGKFIVTYQNFVYRRLMQAAQAHLNVNVPVVSKI